VNFIAMKKKYKLLASLLVQFSFLACTKLEVQLVEKRNVGKFNSIHAGDGVYVFIKHGDTESVEVEADKDYISDVVTEVKNGTLYIKNGDGLRWVFGGKSSKVNVYLTFKGFSSLNSGGGVNISERETLNFLMQEY
jgi:hypothetical protein